MIPDEKAFGWWVKKQRERLGLTLEELAAQVECSKGYLNKLENAAPHSDTGKPPHATLEFLYTLSQKLGFSLVTPLTELGYLKKSETEMENPARSHPIRLLHYYNQLSEADQAVALAMVQTLWQNRQPAREPEIKTKVKSSPKKKKTA